MTADCEHAQAVLGVLGNPGRPWLLNHGWERRTAPPDMSRWSRCGEWLALLRVPAGAISTLGEVYVHKGRPSP